MGVCPGLMGQNEEQFRQLWHPGGRVPAEFQESLGLRDCQEHGCGGVGGALSSVRCRPE